jgi:hypothetical protein
LEIVPVMPLPLLLLIQTSSSGCWVENGWNIQCRVAELTPKSQYRQ